MYLLTVRHPVSWLTTFRSAARRSLPPP